MQSEIVQFSVLLFAGLWAGAQNAVAGGGPLITLAALIFLGVDPRTANLTSTVALFPGQLASGWHGGTRTPHGLIPMRWTTGINLFGGVIGAAMLLLTATSFFVELVPWLILFATAIYAFSGKFRKLPVSAPLISGRAFLILQFMLSVYGGYFGGGNSFMMLALLAVYGLPARIAGSLKNLLIALINGSAVIVFTASGEVALNRAAPLAIGGVIGSLLGVYFLDRIDERSVRMLVIAIGLALTVWMFLHS